MANANEKSKFSFLGLFIILLGVFWCVRGGFLVGSSSNDGNIFEILANVAYCLLGGIICAIGGIIYSWDKK